MNFLEIFCLLRFPQLKSFWCTLSTSFLPRCACTFLCMMNLFLFWWTLFWMNHVFLLEWWILGSSNLMHILFSLPLMEFHFSFLDWVKTPFALMIYYLQLNEFSTCLSCLLGELYQLASKLQGWLLLNTRFKHAYFEFSHPRFRF